MAKWNFFATNSSLIKELDTSGDDVNPQSQSFLAPTLDLQGAKIVFKEGGLYKTALLFTEIGTIDGVNPVNLQDAYDKIIALIPNSSGPAGSQTLQQVTDEGNTTTNDVIVSDGADNETTIKKGQILQADSVGNNSDIGTNAAAFINVDGTDVSIATIAAVFGTQETGLFLTAQQPGKQSNASLKLAPEYFTDLDFTARNVNCLIPFKPDGTYTVAMLDDVTGVPYTGATADVNLGAFDLYTSKQWLYDAPNDNYGSMHLTDGNFHIEDGDGHPMLVLEDEFMQIHKSATIQSNLFTSGLSATRNHYLPNESGTLALTSIVADNITDGVTDKAPSQNAVFDALALKQNSSTLIFDSLQKAIMRDNYFWFVPAAITLGAGGYAFGASERISGAAFAYLNNGALVRGMLSFNTTIVPGILAFSRRNDALILTSLEVIFTRKIQFNSNVSGQRFFCGISKGNQFVAPTNVEPNTLTDIVGICQLSTSTNMHVVYNDASGTATTIDLGSSYPCTDSQYNYYITIEQTTTSYIVSVERVTILTGVSISTANTLTTNIPNYATGVIQPLVWISNNASAAIASYLDGGGIGNVKNQ